MCMAGIAMNRTFCNEKGVTLRTCAHCREAKPLSEFYGHSDGRNLRAECKTCSAADVNRRRLTSEYKMWRTRHEQTPERKAQKKREKIRTRNRYKAQGSCWDCGSPPHLGMSRCERCLERARISRETAKIEMLEQYGKVCACCGESEPTFLTLDHINGGGNAHRRAIMNGHTVGGPAFYAKLKKLGWPAGLQVLCFNCNWAKGKFPECPHERQRRLAYDHAI